MNHDVRRLSWLALGLAACTSGDHLSPSGSRQSEMSSSSRADFIEEHIVDYANGASDLAAPVPTTESDKFHLIRGGLRWFGGTTVEYTIAGSEPIGGANAAVVASEETVDGFITTRSFVHNNSTTQMNPCTGSANTVVWTALDGPGGIVGATSPCFILQTKEIVGFTMVLDQDEPWVIGDAPTSLDVANTATHEFGHVAGLDHVRAPQNACLTLFPFVSLGEVQKRTLGLGDKLGMQALYESSDVTAGDCGS